MKKSKYPRLRSHTRKGKGGQVWTWYTYDRRSDPTRKPGEPVEVSLGTDYAKALEQWHHLHNHIPMTIGRVQEAIERWRERCLPEYPLKKTRDEYSRQLKNIEGVFGMMAWHEVTLPLMRQYLERRSAKTQANREMSVFSIVWGKARLWGMTALPWPAQGVKDWKNQEHAREFEVTPELFEAVYQEADQTLRDCMDLVSATGMRLTDARKVLKPKDGRLRFRASKTGKWDYFVVAESQVLAALVARREEDDAPALTLIVTPTGRSLSERMLRDRYDEARAAAAKKAEEKGETELAAQIRAMYLRDTRKMAADLAEDEDEASRLLQHSSKALTRKHYRTKGSKLKAVR